MQTTQLTSEQKPTKRPPSRMQNSRATSRANAQSRRARRHGYLVVNGQNSGFPCMVKDLTDQGAVISLTGLLGVPEIFSLFIEPDGIKYGCSVTGSRGNTISVSFSSKEENQRYRDQKKRNLV